MTTAAPETAPQEQIADAAAEVFARLAAPGVAAPWESLADFAPRSVRTSSTGSAP